MGELWLVRHGETPWSLTGQHTGRTDVPLTARGEDQARSLRPRLARPWSLVLTSPLTRARTTAELAGLAAVDQDLLLEWDYGHAEGRTTAQLNLERGGWSVWTDDTLPESPDDVGRRSEQLLELVAPALEAGDVCAVGHGHSLRILAATWLGLPAACAVAGRDQRARERARAAGHLTVEHVIRRAVEGDVPRILELVQELAVYEREPDAVEATPEMLSAALFGPSPVASCHVVDVDGEVVGFALWFVTFSTWKGLPGLWLEDLYVRPAARGQGWGKALLQALAAVCLERGYPRFEWWVLDWNVDAQGFYRSLGAQSEDEWTTWRVSGDALTALANSQT